MKIVYTVHYTLAIVDQPIGLLPDTAGMPGTFSPAQRVSDPSMHQGVPWCMPEPLTSSSFLWSQWWRKRSRHSRCMRNLQFYVSAKRPTTVNSVTPPTHTHTHTHTLTHNTPPPRKKKCTWMHLCISRHFVYYGEINNCVLCYDAHYITFDQDIPMANRHPFY